MDLACSKTMLKSYMYVYIYIFFFRISIIVSLTYVCKSIVNGCYDFNKYFMHIVNEKQIDLLDS